MFCTCQAEFLHRVLSVKPKVMWQQLKPHLDLLISRFVFPCLCLTDEELEQFDDDPIEYCRAHFGGMHTAFVPPKECTWLTLRAILPCRLHRRLVLVASDCRYQFCTSSCQVEKISYFHAYAECRK